MSLETGAVALTDIVSRGVVVQWFEGVAVMQEICTALTSQPAGLAPPDPGSVRISADGMVTVRPGSGGEAPVLRLGRLLSDLIAQDPQVPAPLRLCISQATASPPMFSSIDELSKSLSYFERPDRPALIRAIHERYLLTPATQTRPLAADTSVVAKEAKALKARRRSAGAVGRYLIVGAAAAALCVAVIFGRQHLPEALSLEALTLALNLEGLKQEPQADVVSDSGADAAGGRTAARAGSNGSPARDSASLVSAGGGAESAAGGTVLQSTRVAHVGGGPWVDLPAALGAASPKRAGSGIEAYERVTAFADDRVYSNTDARVEPPIMVYPQLPQAPAAVADADTVNALEVVIGDDGLVERVRLVSEPRRLTDMMLLSAAGNWRFSPARLDGVPVAYRTTIRWSVAIP